MRIRTVSAVLGGFTMMVWKRRASAPSFSMYFLYSSSVVAPTHWISPRESAGLKMLEASRLPSEPPAPTMVCNSSIKIMTFSFFCSSTMRALSRSSNWPRYFVPATMEAMSRLTTRLLSSTCGMFFSTIFWARPSTMAVFPMPGSPIRTGLFFLRRLRICTTRSISFSRPITGSSLPSRARLVRSLPKWSRNGVLLLSFWAPTLSPPRNTLLISSLTLSYSRPAEASAFDAVDSVSFMSARSRCSVPIYLCDMERASLAAISSTFFARGVNGSIWPMVIMPPDDVIAFSMFAASSSRSTPMLRRTATATPSPSLMSPRSRCSVPT